MASPLCPTISFEVPFAVKVIFNFTIAFSIFLPVAASLVLQLMYLYPLVMIQLICDDSIDKDIDLDLLLEL